MIDAESSPKEHMVCLPSRYVRYMCRLLKVLQMLDDFARVAGVPGKLPILEDGDAACLDVVLGYLDDRLGERHGV